MIFDTHAHLDYFHENERDDIIQRAHKNGVEKIMTICTDIDKFDTILEISQKYENVFCSIGQHPCHKENVEHIYTKICDAIRKNPKVLAIGETGLDYYHLDNDEVKKWQKDSFISHIDASIETGRPLVIHTRNAGNDTLDILKSFNGIIPHGIMHCFTESEEFMKEAVNMGFYISISGIATFKNANELRDVITKIPLDRLIIETDAPYLAPLPHRGEKNEPSFLLHTATFLSNFLQIEFDKFCTIIYQNSKNILMSDIL